MTRDLSGLIPPHIRIERLRHPKTRSWRFLVVLVFASGRERVMWIGDEYEGAMLRAELACRQDHGAYPSPLLIDDRVLV